MPCRLAALLQGFGLFGPPVRALFRRAYTIDVHLKANCIFLALILAFGAPSGMLAKEKKKKGG